MTFSIVALDPRNGDLGVAVATKALAVGSIVPWASAGVGTIATQAAANPRFGPRGLELLQAGLSPDMAITRLLAGDAYATVRQIGMVDARGRTAAFTGADCPPWAGHRLGEGYACQGNVLVGPETLEALATSFASTVGDLPQRLLAALQAGDSAGGDRRGRQSAALLVARTGAYFGIADIFVNLRVDDHPAPLTELQRLLDIWDQERSRIVPLP
jgi:uncharacterized Ntn-hydrolase superfamily protein